MAFKYALELPCGKHAALFPMLFKSLVKALFVYGKSAFGCKLFCKLEGEPVSIVKSESLFSAYFRFFDVRRVAL